MNVRPPIPASQKFLTVQDALLSEEREERGVVDVETLPAIAKNPRLVLWQGDITTLKADAIVNAANPALRGPVIHGRVTSKDKELLASCYRSCLKLAAEKRLATVAFCCISTGEFHFPHGEAAEIAVKTVEDFLQADTSIRRVIFNVFTDTDLAIYRKLLGESPC